MLTTSPGLPTLRARVLSPLDAADLGVNFGRVADRRQIVWLVRVSAPALLLLCYPLPQHPSPSTKIK